MAKDMIYEEVMDIAKILNKDNIVGFCDVFLDQFNRVSEKNKSLGITPMVKNFEYGFYMLDYGFLVFTIEEYVKTYCKLLLC